MCGTKDNIKIDVTAVLWQFEYSIPFLRQGSFFIDNYYYTSQVRPGIRGSPDPWIKKIPTIKSPDLGIIIIINK